MGLPSTPPQADVAATALSKPGGGVRGIATGDVFRRLMSHVLAPAFAETLDAGGRVVGMVRRVESAEGGVVGANSTAIYRKKVVGVVGSGETGGWWCGW